MTMTSLILGKGANTTNSATRYIGIQSNYLDTWNATVGNVEQVAATSGTLQNFYFTLGTAPGAGTSYAFTVTINGSDTGITVTIADAATTANDTTHTAAFNAGDTIGIKSVPTGTPAAGAPTWAIESVGTDQPLFTKHTVTQNSTLYSGMQAGASNATANIVQNIIPTAGNITAGYVKTAAAPAAGQTITYTLVVNGVDSALTFTQSNPATTASATGTVAVVGGDVVYWKIVATATTGNTTGTLGTEFTPTTNGESIQCYSPSNATTATGNNFTPLASGTGTYTTTEASRSPRNTGTAWTLYNLYTSLNTAPGGAASYAVTVRANAANTAVTHTITGASTTGNDTTHTGTAVSNALLTVNYVGASTPTASVAQSSFVTYLAPPSTTTSTSSTSSSTSTSTSSTSTSLSTSTSVSTSSTSQSTSTTQSFTTSTSSTSTSQSTSTSVSTSSTSQSTSTSSTSTSVSTSSTSTSRSTSTSSTSTSISTSTSTSTSSTSTSTTQSFTTSTSSTSTSQSTSTSMSTSSTSQSTSTTQSFTTSTSSTSSSTSSTSSSTSSTSTSFSTSTTLAPDARVIPTLKQPIRDLFIKQKITR